MSRENLDQLAWAYLMASSRDQPSLGEILIGNGGRAVFPLLRAGLRTAQEFNPLQARSVMANSDRDAAESLWVNAIAEPMLKSIFTIVRQIGQSAFDALVRALWEPDEHFKLLACVVLFQAQQPSQRTVRGIRDWWAINVGIDLETLDDLTLPILMKALEAQPVQESEKRYFRDGGGVMILTILLGRGGDPKFANLQSEFYGSQGFSMAHGDERTRNTALLYMIRKPTSHV